MLPQWENSHPVLHAAPGAGNWIGAASAFIHDGHIYLAYRDRHPIDKGRGNRAYVARSPIDDGVHFETLCAIAAPGKRSSATMKKIEAIAAVRRNSVLICIGPPVPAFRATYRGSSSRLCSSRPPP